MTGANGAATLSWERAGRGRPVVKAIQGKDVILIERIDLACSKSRAQLAARLFQVAQIPPAETERTLRGFAAEAESAPPGSEEEKPPSQATRLAALANNAELFTNPDGDAYGRVDCDGHAETWPVRSRGFRRWLVRQFYEQEERSPSAQAVADAILCIEGTAVFAGAGQHDVCTRIGQYDANIYLDLANAAWQAVEVTPAGWQVVDVPSVRFRRAKAMQTLPTPAAGSLAELRRFLNIRSEDWPLVAAWLLAALRPVGPYPVLVLHGEQGSAKSTVARMLRSIIDPNSAPLRCEPREPRDLAIAAHNGWVVALDNISHLPTWLSDALCRLSTGGGFATRALFENDEEMIFDAQRPVILTGIEVVATRSDLLDRCILIDLPVIPEGHRRPESELLRDFDQARPRLLGALLDGAVGALRNIESTKLSRLPRMADFALWAVAGEQGLGLEPGAFLDAYFGNRESANETALESSPVGKAVLDLVAECAEWTGTASDLLASLERAADDRTKNSKSWPKSPRSLSGILKRLAPNFRAAGVDVEHFRTGKERVLTLRRKSTGFCVTSVTSVTDAKNPGENAGSDDARRDANDATGSGSDANSRPKTPTRDANDASDAKSRPSSNGSLGDWGEV